MGEMFISPSRPFYQSVTLKSLDVLDAKKYNTFAMQKFEDYGTHLDTDVVPRLFDYFSGITSYIQRIMNVMFMRTPQGTTCNTSMIEDSINYLLDLASETYETLLRQMPEKQRDVLLPYQRKGGHVTLKVVSLYRNIDLHLQVLSTLPSRDCWTKIS